MALVVVEMHCEFIPKGKAVSVLAIYLSVKDTYWYECAVRIAKHLK